MSDDVDTGASALRVPPHSEVAEQSVLGALLMDPTAFGRVTDVVGPEDFYSHSHRVIFGAIAQIVSNGHAVDTVAVFEQLQAEFAARRHSLRRDPRGRLRVTHQAHGLSRELADLAEAEKLLRIMGWRPT